MFVTFLHTIADLTHAISGSLHLQQQAHGGNARGARCTRIAHF
jgi:hypothetical protein